MGNAKVQTARAVEMPTIDSASLFQLETHFVAPEIYRRSDVAARQSKLVQIVAEDIIPRLLRLHTEVVADPTPVSALIRALAPDRHEVGVLADIVLGSDLEGAAAYVMVLRERGLSMDALFIELLEPTARRLGEMWDQDECDFIDVTLGVARLQKLLAIFNNSYTLPDLDMRRHVLMAMAPGDQHFFGVSMVERFLLAAGWRVQTELSATAEEIGEIARTEWFAVAGLTAGSDNQLASMTSTISQIRTHSKNPSIGIMVGGPMFTADPTLAHAVGADATAPNAPAAVLVAQKLFDLSILRCREPNVRTRRWQSGRDPVNEARFTAFRLHRGIDGCFIERAVAHQIILQN